MALDERFDVFDRERNWLGTATRREVHEQGLWHQTFHCWVVRDAASAAVAPSLASSGEVPGQEWDPYAEASEPSEYSASTAAAPSAASSTAASAALPAAAALPREPQLLLQLRHRDKDTFPGLLDVSCAGHLLAGEQPTDGVRELEEELGVKVSPEELIYCGLHADESVEPGRWIDREFNHIYLYESSRSLEEYDFQRSEIEGLFFVPLAAFREMVLGGDIQDSIPAEGVRWDEAIEQLQPDRRLITREDLTPNTADYYEKLFAQLHHS